MTETGLKAEKILLPDTDDMPRWACIACDQFTSEKDYWEQLREYVKGKPTALDLVLPEIYLDENVDERIKGINKNIENYIKKGLFRELDEGFILTVRSTPFVGKRVGIVAALDLEKYDYKPGSSALIRATEGTIEERIPPRLKIRRDAAAEFTHIMILFDDEKREITEPLYENRDKLKKLYDFELNMGGGHIEGYFIEDYKAVEEKFARLLDRDRLIKKYGKEDKFLFAVGDGNHSLATAKAHWNKIKDGLSDSEKATHPARFALAEFVNIYDEGIYFEPIYRLVCGVDKEKFLSGIKKVDGGDIEIYSDKTLVAQSGNNSLPDGIRAVDGYIGNYINENGGSVDYIHGENNLKKLVDQSGRNVGILFKKLDKSDLFKYVSEKGAFPRKTFSMGEGVEKRYYLEGRRIK